MVDCTSFQGKCVIVTGSSSGIGRVNAIHFAKLGASIVVTGRNKDRVESVADECRKKMKSSGKVVTIVGDLNDENFCRFLVDKTINELGKIDVLVNNAGIAYRASLIDQKSDDDYFEQLDAIYRTNFRSVLYLINLCVPHLLKSKGNIVNVSSVSSSRPWIYGTAYCSIKAALDMSIKTLTLELSPKGIRINSVNPAMVNTAMLFGNLEQNVVNSVKKMIAQKYPIGRVGECEDVSNAIIFLASDKASFITGHTLVVDGGSKNGSYTQTPPDVMEILASGQG